jgi:hypothetical protein
VGGASPEAAANARLPCQVDATTIKRRDLLGGAGMLAIAGAGAATVPAARAGDPQSHTPQALFDAYVRIRGSLGTGLVYERVTGWAYGTVPGEPPRLLWRLDGFSVARFRRAANGHRAGRYRYLGALRGATDDALLREFSNPYTGERCDVPLSQYGPTSLYLTPGGVRYSPDAPAGPALRPSRLGEWLYFTDQVMPPLEPARQPKFDVVSYGALAVEALDPRRDSVRASSGFSATERWRPWMKMDDQPGALFWHTLSAKVDREDVPADLWALAGTVWGDAIEDL